MRELRTSDLIHIVADTEITYSLTELATKTVADLKAEGISQKKAERLCATFELSRRRFAEEKETHNIVRSSQDGFKTFYSAIADLPHEEFYLLTLKRSNETIRLHKVSQGGTAGTVVDIKILLKAAIMDGASAIMIAHNHPSGNTKPSHEDRRLTEKVKCSAETMDIRFLDRIIVAGTTYYSFADEGEL